MVSQRLRLAIAGLLVFVCSAEARAQNAGIPVNAFRIGLIVPARYPVVGAPFTAEVESTWTGGPETSAGSSTNRVMRDSQGRQRFEAGLPGQRSVTIYDIPAARVVHLNELNLVATVSHMEHVGKPIMVPASKLPGSPPSTIARASGEPLGARTVAGLDAQGWRIPVTWSNADGTTTQLPRDLWLSAAYRMPLMSEYENPRWGRIVEQVTKLDAAEPDAALFTIPAGYTTVDAKPGGRTASAAIPAALSASGNAAAGSASSAVPVPATAQVQIKNVGPCVPMASTSVMAQMANDTARMSTIKGEPFSADAEVTFDQKLPEGNAIHGVGTSHLARDGDGRTRRDTVKRCWQGADGEFHAAWKIEVTDPASRTYVTWEVDDTTPKVAKVNHIREAQPAQANTPEQIEIRKIYDLNQPPKSEFQNESLGLKTIEGVSAEGHRITHAIPVGEAGNDRPMKSIEEYWNSEQLRQVVLAINDNPTRGRTEMRLKDIRLAEPDPALFSPPEGYKIEDVPRN